MCHTTNLGCCTNASFYLVSVCCVMFSQTAINVRWYIWDHTLPLIHTHTYTQFTVSWGGLRHMLRVQWYAIVPPSFPFIHSVKHDTCINSGWILELCVLAPYVFLFLVLSFPTTTVFPLLPTAISKHTTGGRTYSFSLCLKVLWWYGLADCCSSALSFLLGYT